MTPEQSRTSTSSFSNWNYCIFKARNCTPDIWLDTTFDSFEKLVICSTSIRFGPKPLDRRSQSTPKKITLKRQWYLLVFFLSVSVMSQAEAQNSGVGLPSIDSSSTQTLDPVAERLSKEQGIVPMVTYHNRSPVPRDQEEDWETDPENARNWSNCKKWLTVFVVSAPVWLYPIYWT